MNCPKCRNLIPDNSLYCPACGEPLTKPDSATNGLPPVIASLTALFSNKLFFAATILMTISAAVGFIGGGIPIFPTLIAIAMWIAYDAIKKNNVMGLGTPLKMFSGLSLAEYIINWVLVGCFAAVGLIMMAGGTTFGSLVNDYWNYIGDFSDLAYLEEFGGIVIVILGICIIIAAVIVALFNALVVKKMRNCAKSVMVTFQTGINQITNLKFTRNWILVIGILSGVSALSSMWGVNLFAAVGEGCASATYIIFYLLLVEIEKSNGAF